MVGLTYMQLKVNLNVTCLLTKAALELFRDVVNGSGKETRLIVAAARQKTRRILRKCVEWAKVISRSALGVLFVRYV